MDIWHCDAAGNYSGYANQGSDGMLDTSGETFLRGTLIGRPVEGPLEDVKVDWVGRNGVPGLVAAKFSTPAGPVRI